jgi:hypothetical protein
MKGLEPPRLTAPDPKSGAAAITPHPHFCQIFADCYISAVFTKMERKFIHYSEFRNKRFFVLMVVISGAKKGDNLFIKNGH